MTVSIGDSGGGSATAGDTGDSYVLTVSNSGWAASSGAVTLTTTVSTGLTITGVSGDGWSVTSQTSGSATVTRSDALAAGASYSDLTLTVSVDSGASGFVIDTATVSGGGEANTANDNACDGDLVNPGRQNLIVGTDDSGDVTPSAVSGVDTGTSSTPVVTSPGTSSSSGRRHRRHHGADGFAGGGSADHRSGPATDFGDRLVGRAAGGRDWALLGRDRGLGQPRRWRRRQPVRPNGGADPHATTRYCNRNRTGRRRGRQRPFRERSTDAADGIRPGSRTSRISLSLRPWPSC